MVTIKKRVPERAQGPIALLSIAVMVVGSTTGYVVAMVGLSGYLGVVPRIELTAVDSTIIVATGLAIIAIGYVGWRGFMYFSY